MKLEATAQGRHLTLKLAGELDHHGACALMGQLDRAIEASLPHTTELDMRGVSFMDSSGIAVVMRLKRRMDTLGGTFTVIHIPPQAAKVLEAAGIRQYVELKQEDLV